MHLFNEMEFWITVMLNEYSESDIGKSDKGNEPICPIFHSSRSNYEM